MGSTSRPRNRARSGGTRRCGRTCWTASPPPRSRNGSATPPRACTRRCATSGPTWRGPGVLRRPPARPEDRAGQGRRPRPDHRAARAGPLDRRDRRTVLAARGHRVEPHRDHRGDHRGRACRGSGAAPTPPAAGPAAKTCPGPVPWPTRTTPTSPASSPAATRPGWPGCCSPCPDLLALDLPGLVDAAGLPRHPRHPRDLLPAVPAGAQADRDPAGLPRPRRGRRPGAALFAGLTALPKTTALTTYSYRLDHARQAAFLTALDKAAIRLGLAAGEVVNLDFHAVMHWGEDPALGSTTCPARSQRTRSVLTFFAEDADSHALLYANADLAKASQAGEVIAFADHWKTVTGHDPALLVMDSKVTTQDQLWATDRARDRVHHPASPHTQAHRRPARAARQRLDLDDRGPRRRQDPPRPRDRRPRRQTVDVPRNPAPARRRRPGPRRTHPADHQPATPCPPSRSSRPTPGA